MNPKFIYYQSNGHLTGPNESLIGVGYSGSGNGLNNSDLEHVKNIGPIPRGSWRMVPDVVLGKGPFVLRLFPQGHTAHDRTGFLIHGDNSKQNFSASEGCIILNRPIRLGFYQLCTINNELSPYLKSNQKEVYLEVRA